MSDAATTASIAARELRREALDRPARDLVPHLMATLAARFEAISGVVVEASSPESTEALVYGWNEAEARDWLTHHTDPAWLSAPDRKTTRARTSDGEVIVSIPLSARAPRAALILRLPTGSPAEGDVPGDVDELAFLLSCAVRSSRGQRHIPPLHRMLEAAGLGTWERDLHDGQVRISRQTARLLGLPEETTSVELRWVLDDLIHPDDQPRVRRELQAVAETGPALSLDFRIVTPRGVRWISLEGEVIVRDDDLAFSGIVADRTDQRRREDRLEALQRRLEVALDASGIALWDDDARSGSFWHSPNLPELLGLPPGAHLESFGQLHDMLGPGAGEALVAEVQARGETGTYSHELDATAPDGSHRWLLSQGQRVVTPDGDLLRATGTISDITERKLHEVRLAHMATHDALTDLPNRTYLDAYLGKTVASGEPGALLFIDLDRFKSVNDAMGHAAGDRLLIAVADQLQRAAGEALVARIGGDEFAVVLTDMAPPEVLAIAERLQERVAAHRFREGPVAFDPFVSVGLAMFDGPTTPDELLRRADLACQMAKAGGRNRVEVYQAGSAVAERLSQEIAMAALIKDGLEHDWFRLVLQPVVDLATGDTVYHEALLRLRTPEGIEVQPQWIIPIAESMGLIHQIDRWVIRTAFKLLRDNPRPGGCEQLAINLSAHSLSDPRLTRYIVDELGSSGISPRCVSFEITETVLLTNLHEARHHIGTIRDLGFTFSLDDFGSGFSSFTYLAELPVDILKIDGSFIRELDSDPVHQAIVRAINDVSHQTGKQTVAEFVETAEVARCLREIGVDMAQGYWFGRPAEIDQIVDPNSAVRSA